jgi:cytochrome b561
MLDRTSRLPSNTGSETKPSRYHPALVALHWISAVLVLVALATGTFWLTATPNSSPDKIAQLSVHMTLGVAILVLTVARLAVRSKTPHPSRASDLPAIMLAGSGEALPESFSELPSRIAHGLLAQALIALILLHTLGALYHHLFRKDQLLRRVWFEQRASANLAKNMPYRKEAKR